VLECAVARHSICISLYRSLDLKTIAVLPQVEKHILHDILRNLKTIHVTKSKPAQILILVAKKVIECLPVAFTDRLKPRIFRSISRGPWHGAFNAPFESLVAKIQSATNRYYM